MALRALIVAAGMMTAASPLAASSPEPSDTMAAPAGTADTKYCLRVDPVTGSRMVTTQCRTREEWAALEVDVDLEWADNGVRVIA